jgi:acyl carrier protein
MNDTAMREFVLRTLKKFAPGADLENLQPDRRFRDQLDFDSVDFLNFALALQDGLQITIPEEDFPMLATLNGCLGYLPAKGAQITTVKSL